MITGGDTGEADGASQAIGEEGNPAMLAIPVGKGGGYGGCRHGMVRKESARTERIVGAIEETIRIGTVSRIRERLRSCGNSLQGNIQQKAVRDGFCCKQRRVLGVRIFAQPTYSIDDRGNSRDQSR